LANIRNAQNQPNAQESVEQISLQDYDLQCQMSKSAAGVWKDDCRAPRGQSAPSEDYANQVDQPAVNDRAAQLIQALRATSVTMENGEQRQILESFLEILESLLLNLKEYCLMPLEEKLNYRIWPDK